MRSLPTTAIFTARLILALLCAGINLPRYSLLIQAFPSSARHWAASAQLLPALVVASHARQVPQQQTEKHGEPRRCSTHPEAVPPSIGMVAALRARLRSALRDRRAARPRENTPRSGLQADVRKGLQRQHVFKVAWQLLAWLQPVTKKYFLGLGCKSKDPSPPLCPSVADLVALTMEQTCDSHLGLGGGTQSQSSVQDGEAQPDIAHLLDEWEVPMENRPGTGILQRRGTLSLKVDVSVVAKGGDGVAASMDSENMECENATVEQKVGGGDWSGRSESSLLCTAFDLAMGQVREVACDHFAGFGRRRKAPESEVEMEAGGCLKRRCTRSASVAISDSRAPA